MFIDSHCHLDPYTYENSDPTLIPAIIERARAAGIDTMITIAATIKEDNLGYAIKLASDYPEIYFAAGIHPHEADLATPAILARYREALVTHPKAVALGEIGLDYFYNLSTPENQRALFRRQLNMASELKKPVVAHIRDAHDEAIAIFKEEYGQAPALIHCFTGTAHDAERYLELGYYLSAPGIITFKKGAELREVFATLPHDRILLETDSPYLAPVPYRGQPNEPAFMVATANVLAETWQISLTELAKITSQNARKFFNLPAA